MTESATDTALLRRGYRFAKLLTGCDEGALAAVSQATHDVGAHPAAEDPVRTERLFFAAVRKRALRHPARCELRGTLATLHAMPEPVRSIRALKLPGGLPDEEISTVLGVTQAAVREAECPQETPSEQATLDPNPETNKELTALATKLALECHEGTSRIRNPAIVAVGFGFLLLVGVLVWQLTGQIGVFPEEALKIASQARRAQFDQFSPVEAQAANIPDWFAMQGLDGVIVPEEFSEYAVVGVRTFKTDGVHVAQAAATDGEQKLFFLSFPAEPLGIRVLPAGSWRIATSGRNVLAIRQDGAMCFLVSFAGTVEEMKAILHKAAANPPA